MPATEPTATFSSETCCAARTSSFTRSVSRSSEANALMSSVEERDSCSRRDTRACRSIECWLRMRVRREKKRDQSQSPGRMTSEASASLHSR